MKMLKGIYIIRNDLTVLRILPPDDDFQSESYTFEGTGYQSLSTRFADENEAQKAIERVNASWPNYVLRIVRF
jgi:hypothetical protein